MKGRKPFSTLPLTDARAANIFVYGILLNQSERAERAWKAPEILEKRLGSIEPAALAAVPPDRMNRIFVEPPMVHRLARKMSLFVIRLSQHLVDEYLGDARNIWSPPRPAAEVIGRFKAMPGIG